MSFDRYASHYDADLHRGLRLSGETKEFFARGRLRAAEQYLTAVRLEAQRIVEFGCGTGTNIGIMKERWPASEIVGLDISEASLAVARQRYGSERVRLMTPGGYRGPADWVFCNGVFHHIPPGQQPDALRSIRSLLRNGGVLTLFENNPLNPGTHMVMSRIPFDRDAKMINPYRLRSSLRSLGFDGVSCRFLFFFPRFLSLLRPAEARLSWMPFGAQYGVFGLRRP